MHSPECNWEKSRSQCVYGQSHHYCPHEEHRCNCKTFDEGTVREMEIRAANEADRMAGVMQSLAALLRTHYRNSYIDLSSHLADLHSAFKKSLNEIEQAQKLAEK